ncbi:MAG TPA: long-chain-acyl-CoA synthetase [Stellaceae bacterium]|nr:long-chain-acyl-CoA synthetase [Stellaceae bacterium]
MTEIPEDRNAARASWLRALEMTKGIGRDPSLTFPIVVELLAEKFGDAPALLSDGEVWSFRALAGQTSRVARWALDVGLGAGETVALFMPNAPEYLALWLGITRVGGVVALVNSNLAGDGLARSLALVAPRHIIVGAALAQRLSAIAPHLPAGAQIWEYGAAGTGKFPRLDQAVAGLPADPLPRGERAPRIFDRALYIYTSGTTGLAKAANVSHERIMHWSHWFAGMMDTGPQDRMYDCLPMYHGVGGIVAIGAALVVGGSVAIRPGFSVRGFWDDVVRFDCTLFQYIGELCRYLAATPPDPNERRHRIRLCCGSGLGAEVWEKFQARFGIPRILEFYAATEGVVSLYNCEGRPGAIGRVPQFLAHRAAPALVKLDEAGAPMRDVAGRCVLCGTGEVGEALGRIGPNGVRYDGYSAEAESEAKVLRGVFAANDRWFRTGDLMRRDKSGFYYFVDRIGDTFRWKGENVSTAEVAAAIATCPGVIDAAVYGVRVPGAEGRAGMAALVVEPGFEFAHLRRHLAERLPAYARPVFLRLCSALETTGTLRPVKRQMAEEGFESAAIADPLFVDDGDAYVALDAALHRRIVTGELRL